MLTPGKLAGMKAVSDARGVIAAAAMDQRGSLQKSLAKEKGGDVTQTMMEEFKVIVSDVLTRHASAILLDPEMGLPAAAARSKNSGLLLAYEKTGYDKVVPGRLPDLLDVWSVRRLKEAGADCIKILLYYAPSDAKAINDHKHAWTERIGDECRANDIPFFLELIGYEEGVDEKSLEYAKKKPEIVTASMKEFSKDRYGVDVLKLEVPIAMTYVEGASVFKGPTAAYSREEAKALFLKSAQATHKPFIYLSAGVSNAEFNETLELASESGVKYSGVLSSHSWSTPDAYPRIYDEQGFITPYAGDSAGFVEKWKRHLTWTNPQTYWGFGFGADINGLGAQGDPRPDADKNPVVYPFAGLGGVKVYKQVSGEKTFDINKDGVAHYGLYPDWVEDLRHVAGDQIVKDLSNGAEAYLEMWERAEGIPSRGCTRTHALRLGASWIARVGAATGALSAISWTAPLTPTLSPHAGRGSIAVAPHPNPLPARGERER